ncbi:unnamed protein product [Hyaloperonospora brassicae]|uniref:PTHB1 N-terminal domain-containing protein n=1 Tax=Hyaloperonospora brassicae TaxID=162125 RepID=A0AAV0T0S7_HYABA|nr:unnamed protein product [Hyaloperonospora brassicae]
MRGQLELTPTYAVQLDGKILANAHAVGHNGDGVTELLFGSLTGKVSVWKVVAGRLVQWRSCEVDGSVTSICLDYSVAESPRVIVATAEGTCTVFCSVQGAEELQLCFGFTVALNICDIVHVNDELIVATRDGRVLVYQQDHADLDKIAQMEIDDEVEKLIVVQPKLSSSNASTQLLVRCFSGRVFCLIGPSTSETTNKREIVPWSGPPATDDSITFVVTDIEMNEARDMVALVSVSGLVSLYSSSGEKQWDYQLPEAVVNADKLEMTARGGGRQDAVVVCTWSGQLFAIQSEQKLVRFRMPLPSCSMFCVDMCELPAQVDPTIVGISTSGTVFVYRDVQDTLIRGLQDLTLADVIKQSTVYAQLDSVEKRKNVMKKLCTAFPQCVVSAESAMPSVADLIKAMLAVPVQP